MPRKRSTQSPRDKRKFRCDKCPNRKFTNAMQMSVHFKKHPDHRNHKQQVQYDYNLKVGKAKRRGRLNSLPTVLRQVNPRMGRPANGEKFCTQCGVARKPSHNFCGGCGQKF